MTKTTISKGMYNKNAAMEPAKYMAVNTTRVSSIWVIKFTARKGFKFFFKLNLNKMSIIPSTIKVAVKVIINCFI